uniref:Uncharacterized protein n=1 Tax=Mycena chlorophos TaxID=658473 RepID=A0ABQ0L482_MYCCL|nr:predicted protein [Mycena chlorophos]
MSSTIHTFQLPNLPVRLSIGHKPTGQWYLLFAQPYQTADSREVARIDFPAPSTTSSPTRSNSVGRRHRFWFSPHAQSGWENEKRTTLLDLLLNLDVQEPPLFAVVDHDPSTGARKVEVLVPEESLAHFCEGCREWEIVPRRNRRSKSRSRESSDSLRWFLVRWEKDGVPGYLCPACHAKDWCGPKVVRYIGRVLG